IRPGDGDDVVTGRQSVRGDGTRAVAARVDLNGDGRREGALVGFGRGTDRERVLLAGREPVQGNRHRRTALRHDLIDKELWTEVVRIDRGYGGERPTERDQRDDEPDDTPASTYQTTERMYHGIPPYDATYPYQYTRCDRVTCVLGRTARLLVYVSVDGACQR